MFKGILFILINILNIALGITTTVGTCWFALPTLRLTEIGIKVTSVLPNNAIFWITIAAASLLLIFYLIKKYCFRRLLFLSHLLAGKIAKVINRKIQSYENAKELNVVGRSSIIFTNILKLIEILFPEVIVLSLICFCVSWNVAAYFLIILVASLLPMLGNIECDFTTRKEIIRNNNIKDAKFIDRVANKIKGEM